MFEQGYTRLFSLGRIPVSFHYTVVIGLLSVSGFHFSPGAWLGYVLIILLHELGHAILVRSYGLHVYSIEIHGFGGLCRHEGSRTALQRSVISWGGVLMQGALLLAAQAMSSELLRSSLGADLLRVLFSTNLFIIAINLLPLPGLDGAEAWRLPKLLYQRLRSGKSAKRVSKPAAPGRPATKATPNLRLVRDERGDFRFEVEEEEKR